MESVSHIPISNLYIFFMEMSFHLFFTLWWFNIRKCVISYKEAINVTENLLSFFLLVEPSLCYCLCLLSIVGFYTTLPSNVLWSYWKSVLWNLEYMWSYASEVPELEWFLNHLKHTTRPEFSAWRPMHWEVSEPHLIFPRSFVKHWSWAIWQQQLWCVTGQRLNLAPSVEGPKVFSLKTIVPINYTGLV